MKAILKILPVYVAVLLSVVTFCLPASALSRGNNGLHRLDTDSFRQLGESGTTVVDKGGNMVGLGHSQGERPDKDTQFEEESVGLGTSLAPGLGTSLPAENSCSLALKATGYQAEHTLYWTITCYGEEGDSVWYHIGGDFTYERLPEGEYHLEAAVPYGYSVSVWPSVVELSTDNPSAQVGALVRRTDMDRMHNQAWGWIPV